MNNFEDIFKPIEEDDRIKRLHDITERTEPYNEEEIDILYTFFKCVDCKYYNTVLTCGSCKKKIELSDIQAECISELRFDYHFPLIFRNAYDRRWQRLCNSTNISNPKPLI